MPYIKELDRRKFYSVLDEFYKIDSNTLSPGDLNYLLSSIIWFMFDQKISYTKANELIGVLECVKQEFYRRKVVPYENKKIEENKDI